MEYRYIILCIIDFIYITPMILQWDVCCVDMMLVLFCDPLYRDWFRINPLDMILLGCQTLSSNIPARRDVSSQSLLRTSIEALFRVWIIVTLILSAIPII